MVKLVALAIPALLFVFSQPVFGVISLIIPLFVFLVSWIIKSNKQQPGESDEDYAKRMEKLKEKMLEPTNTMPKIGSSYDYERYSSNYNFNPRNIYYKNPNDRY